MAETCGIPFRVRRGTKAQLDIYGPLASGELGWTTDDLLLYAGNGTQNYLVGRVIYSDSNPAGNGISGQLFVNTSTSGIYLSNGSGWLPVGTSQIGDLEGTLDQIDDGIIYKRVAATEVTASGYVHRLNDGTYIVTAEQARDHIDDVTIHRSINDIGTSATDLWSAQRIVEALSMSARGLDWQNSVISISGAPPTSPVGGERYMIDNGTGDWNTYDDYLTEWITASGAWVMTEPNEGFATWVENEDRLYIYYNASWSPMSSVTFHDYLAGLSGTGPEYYHLNSAEFNALTTNFNSTVQHTVGQTMISGGTQQNISVVYDEPNGRLNFTVTTPSHALEGSEHNVTTTSGYFLKATSDSTVGMAPITLTELPSIPHSYLSSVGENDHHSRAHSVLSNPSDHSWGSLTDNTLLGVATSASGVLWISSLDGGSFV